MNCKKCGNKLKDDENLCPNCFTIQDMDIHKKFAEDQLKTVEIIADAKPKKGYVICPKCGHYVKIGYGMCETCFHILSIELYESNRKEKVQLKAELKVEKKMGWLLTLCVFIPLLGLILNWCLKKKDPYLAQECFDTWWASAGRVRLGLLAAIFAIIAAISGAF